MTELLDKFIYIYKDVKIDKYDIEKDLKQFLKANTGKEIDFRTVEGRKILKYIFLQLNNVSLWNIF